MSAPVQEPSDLTPLQRKALREFRDYLDHPLTLAGVCRKSLPAMALLLAYFGGVGVLLAVCDLNDLALLLWGTGIGVFLQLFSGFRAFLRLWPAVATVIDRERLEELLDEPPPPAPDADDWS